MLRLSRRPWLLGFASALALFAGSVVVFAAVAIRAFDDHRGSPGPTASTASAPPGGVTTSSVPSSSAKVLTFLGTLPPALKGTRFLPATTNAAADVRFDAGSDRDGSVVSRYFAAVASLYGGIDALTGSQWRALAAGSVTMQSVGGVGGKPTFVAVSIDAAVVTSLLGAPAKTFPDYDSLRRAMASPAEGPYVALVPLEEMRTSLIAVALDGVDLARGTGDANQWPFVERVQITALSPAGRAALPLLRQQVAATLPTATRVVATGDILQSRCTLAKIKATGDWAATLRSPVGDYLKSANLVLGSLDGSIQDFSTPYLCIDTTNLTSPPEVIQALTLAGITEVTVATNHVFDCGEQSPCGTRAFLRTLDLLHQAGIKTAGGGKNLDEALAPAVFAINGMTFGVLGFDDIAAEDLGANNDARRPESEPGTAPLDDSYDDEKAAPPREPAFFKPAAMLDLTHMQDTIRRLKQQVDVVIVQIQSGLEDTHEASPRSIKGLRAAADAGADLVVGNQGHSVQPIEVRGDAFIAYALGNFIFDQRHTVDETQGYLLEATFWGKRLATVKLLPYQIVDQYKPTLVDNSVRSKILGDIAQGSATLPPPDAVITD